jgi:hypothetical protein
VVSAEQVACRGACREVVLGGSYPPCLQAVLVLSFAGFACSHQITLEFRAMTNDSSLRCDGCGQLADATHIARRLRRLEWATRFRPVHIQTLLLSGVCPQRDREFLYSPGLLIDGEARNILQAVQVSTEGKSREAFLTEFQKLGLMLTHVLECPLVDGSARATAEAFQHQLPSAVARIRRSLKPKRVLLISAQLAPFAQSLHHANLGCPVFPEGGGVLLPSANPGESEIQDLRAALAGVHA